MSVTSVLLDILIVLVAAKVAAEIAERVDFPPVVGEILAGVVIGPSVLDLVGTEQTLQVLGELGVILLLLQVGMEMDLGELGAVGRASVSVAVVGVVVPMAAGFGVSERSATTRTRRCSSAPRSRPRASGSRPGCSAICARWRPSRRGPCSARRSPTTCSAS